MVCDRNAIVTPDKKLALSMMPSIVITISRDSLYYLRLRRSTIAINI